MKGVDPKDLQLTHLYILHNTTYVDPYASEYLAYVKHTYKNKSKKGVQD